MPPNFTSAHPERLAAAATQDAGRPMQPGTDNAATSEVSLDDKYSLKRGRAFMTGTQALTRLPMLQRKADERRGLNTAGYVTGYRGSPLGGVDLALWQAEAHLKAHHIVFQPGLNEDLAATALWGTQQTHLYPGARYDGVFGIWYGKGPGVDRSADAFKHANLAGTSPTGGVLALAGDDHGAKSSTSAHQSEQILMAVSTPILYPSNVQELLDYGLYGIALSRFAGLWVGMKCVTDVVESGATVEIAPDRIDPVLPEDFALPVGGLNIRKLDLDYLRDEDLLLNHKLPAVKAFVRANRLNQTIWEPDPTGRRRVGLVAAGKAYADLRQALTDLGIGEREAVSAGIGLFKVGLTWPLEETILRKFAAGFEEIVVVEEKRAHLETQIRDILYGLDAAPRVLGKQDPQGRVLFPLHGELSPAAIARALMRRLDRVLPPGAHDAARAHLAVLDTIEAASAAADVSRRTPFFCAGCPHSTSTRLPEGSRAVAGIGCSFMTTWMDRGADSFTHMGAEGVTWVGHSRFTTEKHVFVHVGDGTYFHSGSLAIRQAVAAKVNVTYKVLYNDAVAMTGGQKHDGTLTPAAITQQLYSEGVAPVVVVADDPQKYPAGTPWAPGVTIRHRDELDAVQKQLRELPGVSAIVYDQTCAAEKRRRRKKNEFPDPERHALINDAVCEGCGDCSVQSNCIAIEPLESEFGRKRQINRSACNKDFSCLKGFCPAFVTVEGGRPRAPAFDAAKTPARRADDAMPTLQGIAAPPLPPIAGSYGILINGIGGTGVVTVGQVLAMAAHLEGKAVSVLELSGLAQKGGAVTSHVRIGLSDAAITSTRVPAGGADLIVGCDLMVAAGQDTLLRVRSGRTRAVINSDLSPSASFVRQPDWQSGQETMEARIAHAVGADSIALVAATRLATALLGDAIATNMFMLGFAFQRGALPLKEASLTRAIELNGVAVDFNKRAFAWGRMAAVDIAAVERVAAPATVIALPGRRAARSLDQMIEHRIAFLTGYQDAAYAAAYRSFVDEVRAAETLATGTEELSKAVAKYLFKLMAYKDEYEVARLHTAPAFLQRIEQQFEGPYKLHYHLAPPLLSKRNESGELVKREFGAWMQTAFRVLASLKGLRGTAFDVFGRTEERRAERALIGEYQAMVRALLPELDAQRLDHAIEVASVPESIRGYGHVKARHLQAARQRWSELLVAGKPRQAHSDRGPTRAPRREATQ